MAPKARSKSAPKARGKSKAKARGSSSRSRAAASSEATTPREKPSRTATADEEPAAAVVETVQEGALDAEADPTSTAAATSSIEGAPSIHLVTTPNPAFKRRELELNVEDPWGGLSDEEAYGRVVYEAWDCAIETFDLANATGPAHVIANKDGGEKLNREAWPRVAVSLDISGTHMERVDSLPALWLRNINLGGNPLESFEGLSDLFPRLLSLDLSFVDLSSIAGAWDALALCGNLRAISAEGAGVTSFEVMHTMQRLESLELLENSVEELDEIEKLAARCPSLARLDLRENPVASEPGYSERIKEHLPLLMWHDNQSRKQYIAKPIGKCGYKNLNAEVNAVDGLYKNEHCSCLEGNPCIEKETCVDWENREAVAAEARKRKGLRDEHGKQL